MLLSQTDMSPWLEAKPELKNGEDVRTTIQSLRLRLRQTLAEKKDLTEVGLKYIQSNMDRRLKCTTFLEGLQQFYTAGSR